MLPDRFQKAAFVAIAIFVVLSVLSDPEGKGARDVPSVLALVRFAAAVEAAGQSRRAALPKAPHIALSMLPIAERAEGAIYAGLLLLLAFASASEKVGAERPESAERPERRERRERHDPTRALFVRTSGALLAGVCDDILAAGRQLVDDGKPGNTWLGVVDTFKKEATKGHWKRATVDAVRSALDRAQESLGDAVPKEYDDARAALGVAVQSVVVIAEVA
jgi:hypothetical protein